MQGGSSLSKNSKQVKQATSFIWPDATAKICDRGDKAQPSSCRLVLSHNDSCSGAMNFSRQVDMLKEEYSTFSL